MLPYCCSVTHNQIQFPPTIFTKLEISLSFIDILEAVVLMKKGLTYGFNFLCSFNTDAITFNKQVMNHVLPSC